MINQLLNTSSNNICLPKNKKKNVTKENYVESCFIEYFKNRKTKIKNSSVDKKFLLSLLPDVEPINKSQKRRFKREVLAVINFILNNLLHLRRLH